LQSKIEACTAAGGNCYCREADVHPLYKKILSSETAIWWDMDDHQTHDLSLLEGYISGYLCAVRACASVIKARGTPRPMASAK
jgi:hypothetical protein